MLQITRRFESEISRALPVGKPIKPVPPAPVDHFTGGGGPAHSQTREHSHTRQPTKPHTFAYHSNAAATSVGANSHFTAAVRLPTRGA